MRDLSVPIGKPYPAPQALMPIAKVVLETLEILPIMRTPVLREPTSLLAGFHPINSFAKEAEVLLC